MAEKMTRKEMRGPDAFLKAGSEARAWLQVRARSLTLLIVAALVVLGGVAVASYLGARTEAEASRDLGGDLRTLNRAVEGAAASPEALPDNGPPFKSEKEKDEAIVQTLNAFRAKHPSTHAAASAALPQAQALYRLGRYDEALTAYEDYLKIAPPDDPLRAIALEGRGYCYEAKKQLDQAQATFEDLSRDNKTEFLKGMGQYHSARVLIEAGKKDEAARRLAEIPGSAPNTAAARLAQDRMALLASQGVVIPTIAKPPAADAG
jgi:tetratricopeptide (TPR) repeat protein